MLMHPCRGGRVEVDGCWSIFGFVVKRVCGESDVSNYYDAIENVIFYLRTQFIIFSLAFEVKGPNKGLADD